MNKYDVLTLISVKHNDKTITEYNSCSIPRIGEKIRCKGNKFLVDEVIHNVNKVGDSYVTVNVLAPYGYDK
ncbi:hypothetical protein [Brassicibacter mesophilus]|uniref:hypothetical protein n=1 Tax=Brassicibacter mesophilus TaxID=745119 RepID=UPI003D1D9EA7